MTLIAQMLLKYMYTIAVPYWEW